MSELILEDNVELPKNWITIKIDDVAQIVSGFAFKSSNFITSGIPLLKIANIKNGKIVLDSNVSYLSESFLESHFEFLVKFNDIVMSLSGYTGKVALCQENKNILLNQRVGAIRIRNSKYLDSNFLFFYFQFIEKEILKKSYGMAQLNISPKTIGSLLIHLPSINEQKKIVNKINELTSKLDQMKNVLGNVQLQLKQYRESLLKSAFTGNLTINWRRNNKKDISKNEYLLKKISEIRKNNKKFKFDKISPDVPKYLQNMPDSWVSVYLDSLLDDARYGTSEKSFIEKNDVCVIRIPNILSGKLDFLNLKYIKSNKKSFETLYLKKNDILVCRTNGSLDLVGRSAIVEEIKNNCIFASYLIRLRVENEILDSNYLNFLINSIIIRNFITSETRTTAGQFNVNLYMLRSIEIPICDLDEQREIVLKLEGGFSLIKNSENILNSLFLKLNNLRSTILQQAFEGKLVPQDPNDEPAEILLQKIKQEKQQLIQKQKASRSTKNVK